MFCATAKSGLFSQFSTRSLRSPNQKSKHREKFWKPSHFIQPSTVTSSRFVNASAGSSTKLFVPSSWRTWFVTDWEPGAASWAKHGAANSRASANATGSNRAIITGLFKRRRPGVAGLNVLGWIKNLVGFGPVSGATTAIGLSEACLSEATWLSAVTAPEDRRTPLNRRFVIFPPLASGRLQKSPPPSGPPWAARSSARAERPGHSIVAG